MTPEEAKVILLIMKGADNGCPDCAYHLMARFAKWFPQFRELTKEVFEKEFEIPFRD